MDSKTGAAVRWLPIGLDEQNEGVAIFLPCPATDLIRLVNTAKSLACTKSLHRLVRLSPSLMLFSLSMYRRAHRCPPESAAELMAWCQINLLRCINEVELGLDRERLDSNSPSGFQSNFYAFLHARNNPKLRKSLSKFLKLSCGVSKSRGTAIVSELVGSKLRADQFKCKRIRRTKTRNRVIMNWVRPIGNDIDVARLIELAQANLESAEEFSVRLKEEKLASMKQLAYGASHEINNPLANIATRAQTMLVNESDPEKRHTLLVIFEQAMRAHEMISDMMLFAHPPNLAPARISVRILLFRIIHEMKPVLDSEPEIKVNVVVGAGIDQAELDPTQVSVAIKNLLQNSIEALQIVERTNRQIEVRVDRSEADELMISIWDNGERVSVEVARHMFDPFYSGREAGRGLGFGLSKVWTIAKLHGGTVRYDNRVNSGTMFVLTLPMQAASIEGAATSILRISQNDLEAEGEAA